MPNQPVLAVVSVLGKDQKGVVAQFATYMAERGINIQDIEQRVVRGFFVMDMLVDLADLTVDLTEIISVVSWAPSWRASAHFVAPPATAMTSAPWASAICTAAEPHPPAAPVTSTVSPSCNPPRWSKPWPAAASRSS